MQVDINGIHLTVSEELDGFIRKKVEKITKYLRDSATCHVTLKSEKERYEVEVSVALKGTLINGKDTGNDLQTCVEQALKKVIHQLKKYKEKKRSHKVPRITKSSPPDAEPVPEEIPVLLQTTRTIAKPMQVDEALLQLKNSRNSFLIFLNAETNQINAVYKREDGGLILVEPS